MISEKTRSKKISITKLIVLFLILLVILQAILFLTITNMSGTQGKLAIGAQSFISKNLSFNRILLERKMIDTWGNLDNLYGVIRCAKEIGDAGDYAEQEKLAEYMLGALQVLGSGSVSVVLYRPEAESVVLSIADSDPKIAKYDYADNSLLIGPREMAKDLNISLHESWKPTVRLSDVIPYDKYREKVEKLCTRAAIIGEKSVSAWEYYVAPGGEKRWHFITPIIANKAYAPLGFILVDVDLKDVMNTLYHDDHFDQSIYAYALMRADTAKCRVGETVELEVMGFTETQEETFRKRDTVKLRRIENPYEAMFSSLDSTFVAVGDGTDDHDSKYIIFLSSIRVINTEDYADYYLLLLADRAILEMPRKSFENGIIFVLLGSVVIGVLMALILNHRLSLNVSRIINQVRNLRREAADINLHESSISEFDTLLKEIRILRSSLQESSQKFQSIFDLAEFPVVALEIDEKAGVVYKIGRILDMLEIPDDSNVEEEFSQQVSLEHYTRYRAIFYEKYRKYISFTNDDDSVIEIWESLHIPEKKYLKIASDYRKKTEFDTDGAIGKSVVTKSLILKVITDCTDDILEQNRIKEQRDRDTLTGLLNRFSFKEKVEAMVAGGCKRAAMIMWDLDELKFVNDAYGHDMGDLYIKAMGDVLKRLEDENTAVARISGDEFFAFVPFQNSRSEVRDKIYKVRDALLSAELYFSEQKMSIRATAGIAWYPDDTDDIWELYKFADFAMYSAKHSNKGTIAEFVRKRYDDNYIYMLGNQHFETFISEKLVDFAFQPIVNSRTGKIFAYEALMRPTSEHIKSVDHVLKIARKQHRLAEVETLTLETLLKRVKEQPASFENKRIFFNSIANISLSEEELRVLDEEYAEQFSQFVIEIIEQEDIENDCLRIKQDAKKTLSMQIAIDDYGNGYSTKSWLVNVHPDYVKIDMALIRGVEKDEDKRETIKNIVETSKRLGIQTICEGIETYAEMKTLIRLGVDFLQGYYIGKPAMKAGEIWDKVKEEIIQLNIVRRDS